MYEIIKNFVGGLDARRFYLSLPAGTLRQGDNGHITQGGEFEKRKAFVKATLPSGTGYTFGFQETPSGVMVFGSASAGTVGTLPAGYVYQQLVYPANGANASAAYAMTGVVWSSLFGGNAFVIATFADGSVFPYYNGTVITDFYYGGRQINFASVTTVANSLITEINAVNASTSNYVAATVSAGVFDVTAKAGNDYTPASTLESAHGTISSALISSATPVNAGLASVGSFQIMAGQAAQGSGVVTFASRPNVSDTVTINGQVYTFVDTLGSTQGNVIRGASATTAATNFLAAINLTGGGNYVTPTNSYVTGAQNATVVTISSILTGSGGNYAVSTSSGGRITLSGLSGGNMKGGDNSAISQILVGTQQLLTGQVDFVGDVVATATAVATAIIGNPGCGYKASSAGGIVSITKLTVGKSDNDKILTITCKGSVCVDSCKFVLAGTGFDVSTLTVGAVSVITGVPHFPSYTGQQIGDFMNALAANINGNTANTGYLAAFYDNSVFVSRAVTTSSDTVLTLNVATTAGGGVSSGGGTLIFPTVNYAWIPILMNGFGGGNSVILCVVTPAGGTAPYTYQWTTNNYHLTAVTPTLSGTLFAVNSANKETGVATCTVTDVHGATGTIDVSLSTV